LRDRAVRAGGSTLRRLVWRAGRSRADDMVHRLPA
jgi:hypothetical protein